MTPTNDTPELIARLDERQKALMDKLNAIHDEVKKTNGRVTSLESWRSEIRGSWKATIFISAGIGSVVGFLGNHFF